MQKKVIIGADPFPPYQWYNAEGKVEGLDYDVVTAAFEKAGYETEVILRDFPLIERDLQAGAIQAAFQVQLTPEREKIYQFSHLLREAVTELVTWQSDLEITEYQQIVTKALTLGVLEGYVYGRDIDSLPQHVKKVYPDNLTLLKAISAGEVDLGVFDRGVKEYLSKQENITNLRSLEAMAFLRPLYVIFMDTALRDDFNKGLESIR